MYELDKSKDQVMTVFKAALVNLVMWTRDHYFPASHAHATWKRLTPFFHLPGVVTQGRNTVEVALRPFSHIWSLTRPIYRKIAERYRWQTKIMMIQRTQMFCR